MAGKGFARTLTALLAAALCLCALSSARADLRDDIDYITAWTLSPEWRTPEEKARARAVGTADLLRVVAELTGADRAEIEAIPTDEDAFRALSALAAESLAPEAEAKDAAGAWEVIARHFGGEAKTKGDRAFAHMAAAARALDDGSFAAEIDGAEAALTEAAAGDEGALAEARFRMVRVIALELLREAPEEALRHEEPAVVTGAQAKDTVVPEGTESPEPAPEPEAAPEPSAAPQPTEKPAPTGEPTAMPEVTPTHTEKPSSGPEATPAPTEKPTPGPSATPAHTEKPAPGPSATPAPTVKPQNTPAPTPTAAPVTEPTPTPAGRPAASPASTPARTPTPDASPAPTSGPAVAPAGTPEARPAATPENTAAPGGGDSGEGQGGAGHAHQWRDVTETVTAAARGHWDTAHHEAVTHTETVTHPEEGHYETLRHEAATHEETRTIPARTHTEETAHPEEGHYETVTVVDQEAWEETVRVVDQEGHWVTGTRLRCDCGAELCSIEAYDAHYRAMMRQPDGRDHDSYTSTPYDELVGEVWHYETVHHEAVTHTEPVWRVDRPAWTETVTVVDEEERTETVTVVDREAWEEQVWVTDKAAWTETVTVVDAAAWDERVWIVDEPEHSETRVTGQVCAICGAEK